MRETINGVSASVYDMAVVGGVLGGRDSTIHQGKESSSVAKSAKVNLVAEAFAPSGPAKPTPHTHNYVGVAVDLANGMVNEVVNHPGHLLEVAGESALAGLAFRLAPPAVREFALTAGALYAGLELGSNAPKWYRDASTVVNAQSHTAEQVARAHAGLENLGGGVVDLAAGGFAFKGGMYAPEFYSAARGSVLGYRTGTLNASEVFPSMKNQFEAMSKTIDWNKNPSWMKPKEVTLLSHQETSTLFENLATKGSDYTFVKKPYTVTIRDGVPGETVMDIQSKPQLVAAGNKVVQRIMPDGAVDTYPIDNQTFLARWTASAKTPGEYTPTPIPTKMVLLDRAVQIPGHAGPQLGNVQDMLATDGTKFWTVQKAPLLDTYVGVDEKSQAILAALRQMG